MKTTVFHKLVRDNIPEIIQSKGDTPHIRIMTDGEYHDALIQKVGEELREYAESRSLEELADLLEVILSLASFQGYSYAELDQTRLKKRERNGGFEKKILLHSVDYHE